MPAAGREGRIKDLEGFPAMMTGEPLSGGIEPGEKAQRGNTEGAGEMHGAGIMPDEKRGVFQNGGRNTRRSLAAQIEKGTMPKPAHSVGSFPFVVRAQQNQGCAGEFGAEHAEQLSPVIFPPIFYKEFGAHTGRHEVGVTANIFRPFRFFGRGKQEAPIRPVGQINFSQRPEARRQALGFGFVLSVLQQFNRQIRFFEGRADNLFDTARTEEPIIPQALEQAAAGSKVDHHLRTHCAKAAADFRQLLEGAGANGVIDDLVAEAAVLQNGHGRRSLAGHGLIRQQNDGAIREDFADEMKTRQGDHRIAQTSESIN